MRMPKDTKGQVMCRRKALFHVNCKTMHISNRIILIERKITPWCKIARVNLVFKAYFHLGGPGCIPVFVLKNCDSELCSILADLFNVCLKESYFSDC